MVVRIRKLAEVVRDDFPELTLVFRDNRRSLVTNEFDAAGGKAEPFPGQFIKSLQDGANHLGGDLATPDVDPDREFMPAGQGGGAIDELVPAGELVTRFVAEAEAALARSSSAL